MMDRVRDWAAGQIRAIKPAFLSKKPHFNFISAHYTWILSATVISSVIIYGAGRGKTLYIDSLMFASGANTQAGLNPIDVNDLNTFQQVVIYLFTMFSNPITMHATVVVLRLYWFEKRFQGWVSDARMRRGTLSKAKSRARDEVLGAEEGVNGRNITVVPHHGRPPRLTNDGILLEQNQTYQSQAIDDGDDDHHPPAKASPANSDSSDTATVSAARSSSLDLETAIAPDEALPAGRNTHQTGHDRSSTGAHTAITFADTVKRSDGIDDETKFLSKRSNAEHIAILERQRNQDNEVLRIPGPRDIERGMAPRLLDEEDAHDNDGDTIAMSRSRESRPEHLNVEPKTPATRRPTIVIAEPQRPKREEIAEDVKAAGGVLDSLRARKPRAFNRGQKQVHEDNEDGRPVPAFRTRTLDTIRSVVSKDYEDMPYLSYTPTMARNSNFVGLTLEQREELGGIEYRSLRTLAIILLFYFFGFHLIAMACMTPFILHNNYYGEIVDAADQSRVWWGFFTANSAFMDLGLTLTPDSMNSFNTSDYVMMILWFFIIIGNTGFPVMLRFVIWVLSKVTPSGSGLWEELRFLLDHPRRCFTLLFPSSANWWLFWILVALNVIDLLFFLVLDLNSEIVAELPMGTRIADGLFQAASTRTAGFSCFPMSSLHPAMPVLYMIMMYISVFPIAISIRRTNVYEEKSLGVYDKEDENDGEASALSYVGTHLRRQLSFDLWYVFTGFFFLAIAEGGKLKKFEFTLFDLLFEVISAYGTSGLSMGVLGVDASLCSQFSVVGKLIIIAMQIRGRHRGLPYGLDRAVLLPSEGRFQKEAEVDQPILVRTRTGASTTASGVDFEGGAGSTRRRRSSAGRERPTGHIITQLLYPGPVIRNDVIHGHKRAESNGSRDFPRSVTEPAPQDEEKDEIGPLQTIESHQRRPRRADSMPIT